MKQSTEPYQFDKEAYARNQTLHEQYGRKTVAWEPRAEPIFRVWIDDDCRAFPYHSFGEAKYNQENETLSMDFAAGTLIVTGPKAWDFFDEFCQQHATLLVEDGVDIVKLSFILRS